jgi:hypothetical protein
MTRYMWDEQKEKADHHHGGYESLESALLLAIRHGAPSIQPVLRRFRVSLRFVVRRIPFWQHAPMQYPGNQNAVAFFPIENDVPALLHPSQPRRNLLAPAAQQWIPRKLLAAILERI